MLFIRVDREGLNLSADYRKSRSSIAAALLVITASLIGICAAYAGDLDDVIAFNIEAQTLDKALLEFGAQAHVQIMFASRSISFAVRTQGLRGEYTSRNALSLLLKGTAFKFEAHANTITITATSRKIPVAAPISSPKELKSEPRAGPIIDPDTGGGGATNQTKQKARRSPPGVALQEVVVTGTHISGAAPQSVPLMEFSREDIDQAGYPTLQGFMNSIPQNLGAVGSGSAGLLENNLAANAGFGTGVDLRGLGFESTLVLVDGHRLPPGGPEGAFTDVSVIPLSAIERIEILMDGASAIYGSDAVGGVVNYILRKDEAGAESSIGYGSVTHGGLKDFNASQSVGSHWSGGSGFLSYEFHDGTPLESADRSFSRTSLMKDIVPESRQNSLFGTVHQRVSSSIELTADILYTDRHAHATFEESFGPPSLTEEADTKEYSVGIGANIQAGNNWVVTARVSDGGNTTQSEGATYLEEGVSKLLSAELSANGSLLTLKSGPVRAAVGSDIREQRLSQRYGGQDASVPTIGRTRTISSFFVETRIPLLGPRSTRSGSSLPSLELDVAGRYEHYTDFGSSGNPEIGVAWQALQSTRFRSTWSSSFAAPELWELYGPQYSSLVNSIDQSSPSGKSAVLLLSGANPELSAERSSQWTAGLDFTPSNIPGFKAAITYYHIHYRDRIAAPNFSTFTALESGPTFAPYIQLSPSAETVAQFSTAPFVLYNDTVIPLPIFGPPRSLADVMAIADNRVQNIGVTDTDGLDLTSRYDASAHGYNYGVGVAGTYVFHLRNTPRPGTSTVNSLSTLNNPVNFRTRATVRVSRGAVGGTLGVNYFNHYVDNTVAMMPKPVASWTTVDLGLDYRIEGLEAWTSPSGGVEVSINCENCFDRPPPKIDPRSDIYGRGYDPANANPLGRFVSATLRARW